MFSCDVHISLYIHKYMFANILKNVKKEIDMNNMK